MRVGALEETITVSGSSPLIDAEQSARTQVLSRELLDVLPSARTTALRGAVLPGVTLTTPDVGGARSTLNTRIRGFGMNDQNVTHQIDGFQVNSQGGANLGYMSDASIQEVSVTSIGQPAEVSAGGMRVNNIPRDGGNMFSGDAFLGGTTGDWQSSNLDPERHKNVQRPPKIAHIQNFGVSIGGPVLHDRLWFYSTARHVATSEEIVNGFFGDGTPITEDNYTRNLSTRLTYQASPALRMSASLDRIFKRRSRINPVGTDPKAAGTRSPRNGNYNFAQARWTWTASNRWFVEGGYSPYQEDYGTTPWPGTDFLRGTAEWLANATRTSNTLVHVPDCELPDGCSTWRTYGQNQKTEGKRRVLSTSASYVTGSHNLKFGVQWGFGDRRVANSRQADLVQRYRGTEPIEVQIFNTPTDWTEKVNYDLGIDIQDTWRVVEKLTLNLGLRVENLNGGLPETRQVAGRFVDERVFPAQENLPNWNGDLAPRFGAVYDVFGHGGTVVKGSISKYYKAPSNFAGRYNLVQNSSSVFAWTDLNGDDIAQEAEFINNRGSNANFGLAIPVRAPDPDLKRPYNLEYALQVTHELLPRLAVNVSYLHRSWKDYEASRNTLVSHQDWLSGTAFQLENPLDPGHTLTAYQLPAPLRGQSFTVDYTNPEYESIFDGIEVGFQARFANGSNVYGGFSTERNIAVDCGAAEDPNAMESDIYQGYPIARGLQTGPDGKRWCDQRELGMPWRPMFKVAGNLPLPLDLQLAANLQSYAGREYAYTWRLESFNFPGGSRVGTEQVLRLSRPAAA